MWKTCLVIEVGLAEAGLGLGEGLISLLGGLGGGLLLGKLVVRHPVSLGCSLTFLTDLYLQRKAGKKKFSSLIDCKEVGTVVFFFS